VYYNITKHHGAIKNAQHAHLKVVILRRVSFTEFPNNKISFSLGAYNRAYDPANMAQMFGLQRAKKYPITSTQGVKRVKTQEKG
jgi:hypothetical protein